MADPENMLDVGDEDPRAERARAGGGRSRANDDRKVDQRPSHDSWSPANALTTPKDHDGFHYRWVAEYVLGSSVPNNVQRALRERWERVKVTDIPEDFIVDEDRGDGYARTGGLILMRTRAAFVEQRNNYYRKMSKDALYSANQLQGVAGLQSVQEDRGSRTLTGAAARDLLRG